jgi:hypothetical protein
LVRPRDRGLFLLFNQQLEQQITLGFVQFCRQQPTEASDVLAADESLKSLLMFRCRTIHWESPSRSGYGRGACSTALLQDRHLRRGPMTFTNLKDVYMRA